MPKLTGAHQQNISLFHLEPALGFCFLNIRHANTVTALNQLCATNVRRVHKHTQTERWWRLRVAALPSDPGAAFLLAQLYLNRLASREVCDALQQAADRGGQWDDLPSAAQAKLDEWFADGGRPFADRFAALRTKMGGSDD